MINYVGSFPPALYRSFKQEGFDIPEKIRDVRLVMPADGVFELHYTVPLTGNDLAALGRALVSHAMWFKEEHGESE